MHPSFLSLLCCPLTGESLSLEIERQEANGMVVTGALRSESGRRFPIIRGVPRFVQSQEYASSFGVEWNRWPRTQFEFENIGRPMEGHTTRMWERITSIGSGDLPGRSIVEFGCGPGRFLDVVRRKGARAVGIDLSNAVDAARKNFSDDPDVLIVQGDLLRPPFKPGSFDGGYTIGVLHHTPSPADGLASLAGAVRSGGWLACCVYPKGDFYDFRSVRNLRRLHQLLKPLVGYRFAMAYAWFAAYALAPILSRAKRRGMWRLVQQIEQNWLVCLRLKDPRWRVLDVFDAITPAIATTHTAAEVKQWMERAGCRAITTTPWCPTSAAGIRRSEVLAQAA